MKRRTGFAFLLGAWLATLLGCEEAPPEPTLKGKSPNASIQPTPLSGSAVPLAPPAPPTRFDGGVVGIPVDSAGRLTVADAGPPPATPLRPEEPLTMDSVATRDTSGLSLTAEWRWEAAPKPPSGVAANPEAAAELRRRLSPVMSVELASVGRMRLSWQSPVFPFPPGTELRSRLDRTGHVLVWPSRGAYRAVAPGGLRALFAERRADVTPLVHARVKLTGRGSAHGFDTQRHELRTGFGVLSLEQARVTTSGPSGMLLCRALVELMGVEPTSEACAPNFVPVNAEFRWQSRGGITWAVTELTRRTDLRIEELRVPPGGAEAKPGEFPPSTTGILLSPAELGSLRRAPSANVTPEPGAPGEGLRVVNHEDGLRYVLVDGVPAAWVPPGGSVYLLGLPQSYYFVSWRDFLGGHVTPEIRQAVPGVATLGSPVDAGAP